MGAERGPDVHFVHLKFVHSGLAHSEFPHLPVESAVRQARPLHARSLKGESFTVKKVYFAVLLPEVSY